VQVPLTPSSVWRTIGRHHRKPHAKLQTVTPPLSISPAYPPPQSELDYVHVHHHADVEPDLEPESDQMDWIGDRLTRLILEGQKALGREIVVMSDAKEVEVDDGSNDWEEGQDNTPIPPVAVPSISLHILSWLCPVPPLDTRYSPPAFLLAIPHVTPQQYVPPETAL